MGIFEKIFRKKSREYNTGYSELDGIEVVRGKFANFYEPSFVLDTRELFLMANAIVETIAESDGENVVDDNFTMIDAPEDAPFHKVASFEKLEGVDLRRFSPKYIPLDHSNYHNFLCMIKYTNKGMEISIYEICPFSKGIFDPGQPRDQYPDYYEDYMQIETNKVFVTPEGKVSRIEVAVAEQNIYIGKDDDNRKYIPKEGILGKIETIENSIDSARRKKTIKR